jgi:hypothetical protein
MQQQPKTIEWAVYPDGHEVAILREHGMWRWDRDSASDTKAWARTNAIKAGARIERRPNPNYRPRLLTFERLMGPMGKGTRS